MVGSGGSRKTHRRPSGALLSRRELECLRWKARGKTEPEIAIILGISRHTVRWYAKSILIKLDCITAAQAVSKAVELGLPIQPSE